MKLSSIIALFYIFGASYAFSDLSSLAKELAVQSAPEIRGQDAVNSAKGSKTNGPATKLAAKLYDNADLIFNNAKLVHYAHLHLTAKDQVNSADNIATTDCSGFISYVLQSTAPEQYLAVRAFSSRGLYPKAHTYASFFAQLGPLSPQNGWEQIQFYQDLRRGDLIAWKKDSSSIDHRGHGNSGHVMMVIDQPNPVENMILEGEPIRYVSIHVLDSSSVRHFGPEILPPLVDQLQRDGLGKGFIRLILDEKNVPIGYWEGTFWGERQKSIAKPSYSSIIRFARLVELQK